jgi:hypothetical protein
MSDSPVCELRAGALRAAVRPDLGASLAGLWWQGEPLLRSCEPGLLAGPRQSACFALLPYSNRIGHCRFDWRGQHYSTRANFDDHPHSLHGVGWQRAWTVTAHTPERLQLGLRHEPDADWPFRLFGHPGAAAQRRRARVAPEPAQLRRPRTAGRPGLASLLPAPRRQPFADARGGPLGAG